MLRLLAKLARLGRAAAGDSRAEHDGSRRQGSTRSPRIGESEVHQKRTFPRGLSEG